MKTTNFYQDFESWYYENLYENEGGAVGGGMGGVSSPMSTLYNTVGIGNADIGGSDRWDSSTNESDSDKTSKTPQKYKDIDKKKKNNKVNEDIIKLEENNLNPYDKIGSIMAKKMGVRQPFKKKNSKTNTVSQKKFQSFQLETLDDYIKASKHVPKHPLQIKKKMNEETVNDIEHLKNVKAKNELVDLGINFIYKPGPSGTKRVYIKGNINDTVKKLLDLEWKETGTNPENSIKKFHKGDKEIAIFADGKDLPRITLKPIQKKTKDAPLESLGLNKLVSNSLEPYIK